MIKESEGILDCVFEFSFERFATVHIVRLVYRIAFAFFVLFTIASLVACGFLYINLHGRFSDEDRIHAIVITLIATLVAILVNITFLAIVRLKLEHLVVVFVRAHRERQKDVTILDGPDIFR